MFKFSVLHGSLLMSEINVAMHLMTDNNKH